MKIKLNLKFLEVETETTWRQVVIVCAVLIFFVGIAAMCLGYDKEVALAVVAALGVVIGAFVHRPREDDSNTRGSGLVRGYSYLKQYKTVWVVACIYSGLIYCLF